MFGSGITLMQRLSINPGSEAQQLRQKNQTIQRTSIVFYSIFRRTEVGMILDATRSYNMYAKVCVLD